MTDSETRLLESPSDVCQEIDRRLAEDGLNPQCTEEEKLFYVWRLYLHAEADLHRAMENEEKLKRDQTEEMQEVENYVEHIRHLSDEREALIQELETENDQLKTENEQMKLEIQSPGLRDETAEMLIQQGLEEIAMATTSEQIAFLLVERARLLDELEAMQTRTATPSEVGLSLELQRTLEKERSEMEDEIAEKNNMLHSLRDSLRKEHEEEISTLMEDNQKIDDDLNEAREKVYDLEDEVKLLKSKLEQEKSLQEKDTDTGHTLTGKRAPSPARSPSDVTIRKIIEDKTKVEGEVVSLRAHSRQLESENDKLSSKISTLEQDLEYAQVKVQNMQMKMRKLELELEESEEQLDESDLQNIVERLTLEREDLGEQLETLQQEIKSSKSEMKKTKDLQETVEILTNEKQVLSAHIDSLKQKLDMIINEKDDLEEQKFQLSKTEVDLNVENETLKAELDESRNRTEQFDDHNETLQKTLAKLHSTNEEIESLRSEKYKLNCDTELLSKENKELLNRMELLERELDHSKLKGQDIAKQEIIVTHMREQNQRLNKDLSELKETELDLRKTQECLQKENNDMNNRCKQEIESFKAKLELTLNELSKAKSVVEQERSENSELQNRTKELEQLIEFSKHDPEEKNHLENELENERKENLKLHKQLDETDSGQQEELEDLQDQLDRQQMSRTHLENQIQEMEQILDDQKLEQESIQQRLNGKIKSLENRVNALQDDLFAAQDELQAAQEKHEEMLQAKVEQTEFFEKADLEKLGELSSLAASKTDERIDVSQKLECQQAQNMEKQIQSMKVRLAEAEKQLDGVENERDALQRERTMIKDSDKHLEKDNDSFESDKLRQELVSAHRELQHVKLSIKYEEEDRHLQMDKISSLEDLSKKLELDNRELATKLSESFTQLEQLKDQLKRERNFSSDKHHSTSRHLSQVEADLAISNQQLRQFREDVHKRQSQCMKLEADNVGTSAKYESTISRLDGELSEMKQYHANEIESLTLKLEGRKKEVQGIQNQLHDKEQENIHLQHENCRLKTTNDRQEAQLQMEGKIRTDTENRNTTLEQEVSKFYTQMKTVREKCVKLETSRKNLEDDLDRKTSISRHTEVAFTQRTANQEVAYKSMQNRAENSEKRADRLQHEFDEMSVKVQGLESQLRRADTLKSNIQDKKDQITQLKNQLEGEKLQRTLLDQTVIELKHQVSLLRQRESRVVDQNRELQHTMLDMESKLETISDRTRTPLEMEEDNVWAALCPEDEQQMSDMGKRSMMGQILHLQKEIKILQQDMLSTRERHDIQERKHEDRKLRTKAKLMKAREFYSRQQSKLHDHMVHLDEELHLTRSKLHKEIEWRDHMDSNYKQTMQEKHELSLQISDNEEQLREKTRLVSLLQIRTQYLEEENQILQERLDSISHQKLGLEKVMGEYKPGKDPEISGTFSPVEGHAPSLTAATSGIGTSIDSTWDHDHLVDAILSTRTAGTSSQYSTYLSHAYPGNVVDLNSRETDSEEIYFHEYDA